MSYLVLTEPTMKKALVEWVKKHSKLSGMEFSGAVQFVDEDGKRLTAVLAHLDIQEPKR